MKMLRCTHPTAAVANQPLAHSRSNWRQCASHPHLQPSSTTEVHLEASKNATNYTLQSTFNNRQARCISATTASWNRAAVSRANDSPMSVERFQSSGSSRRRLRCVSDDMRQEASGEESTRTSRSSREVTYTSLGGNSWKMHFKASGVTVLTDPWLVDSLTFGDAPWLYEARKPTSGMGIGMEAAKDADIVLLTQGLDDHTHCPTLSLLPRSLPVVASPSAADVARRLGFLQVVELRHGDKWQLGDLEMEATEGARVGPPWSMRENGYILREKASPGGSGVSCYYEPHNDFSESSMRRCSNVDILIAPACQVSFGMFPLVKGPASTAQLVDIFRPSVIIPLLNAELAEGGIISPAVNSDSQQGQIELRRLLTEKSKEGKGSATKVVIMEPPVMGKPHRIRLLSRE